MGLDRLLVRLEGNADNVYYEGQEIIGAVVVVASGEGLKNRNIRIKLHGAAEVHWKETRTEGSGDNQRTVTKHYRNEEHYIDQSQILYPPSYTANQSSQVLPAGSHTFPFSFRLPNRIPSSFEGKYGWVRYYVKVRVDRPWAFDNTSKHFFTVISVVDLNKLPALTVPFVRNLSENFYTFCFSRGTVAATVRLNRTGFVPGEHLIVETDIDNTNSQVGIQHVHVVLRQMITFKAKHKRKTRDFSLAECTSGEGVEEGQKKTLRQGLRIPKVEPCLKHCSIIDIDYWLKVKIVAEGCHGSMSVKPTLTFATIPLMNELRPAAIAPAPPQPQPPMPSELPPDMRPSAPPGRLNMPDSNGPSAPPPSYAQMSPLPEDYPEMPPPSYSEAINVEQFDNRRGSDDDGDGGDANWNYRPKYPVWTFNK